VAAGRDAGEHPFHHQLGQQVIVGEGRVGVELDLGLVEGAAPWPLNRHAPAAQHDRAWRVAVPVRLPVAQLGVLRGADLGGHLRVHHLVHHEKADRSAHRQQALPRHTGDRHERHAQLLGQLPNLGGIVALDETDSSYVPFRHGGWSPSLDSDVLADAQHLPRRQASGGGPPPHFNKTRDNLAVGAASYSLFLWHYPVILWLRAQGLNLDGPGWLLYDLLLTAVVAGGLSALTYRFIEVPALRRKRSSIGRPKPEPPITSEFEGGVAPASESDSAIEPSPS
jgi:hypothetical protein